MPSHRFEGIDLDLLYRFAAGAASPEEHERVIAWLAEDAERGVLLDALGAVAERPEELVERFDAGAARARLERDLAAGEGSDAVADRADRRLVLRPRTPRAVPRVAQLESGGEAWRWLTAAAAVLVLFAGAWWVTPGGSGGSGGTGEGRVTREYATERGQLMRVRLPDGTTVTLGAASRLRYAGGDGAREVALEGEAVFGVAHDERRPFVVRAGGAVARDVGTTFGVRAYPGDSGARVVVAEGSVSLRADGAMPAAARVLEPGELGRLERGGATEVKRVDAARYLSWAEGRLEFDDVPLRDVAAQLSRWYDVDVVLADSALGGRRFTGAFERESVDQVLAALAPPLHARYERRGRTVVLHTLPNDH